MFLILAAYTIYCTVFIAIINLPAVRPVARQALATLGETTSTSIDFLRVNGRRASEESSRFAILAARPLIIVYSYQTRPRLAISDVPQVHAPNPQSYTSAYSPFSCPFVLPPVPPSLTHTGVALQEAQAAFHDTPAASTNRFTWSFGVLLLLAFAAGLRWAVGTRFFPAIQRLARGIRGYPPNIEAPHAFGIALGDVLAPTANPLPVISTYSTEVFLPDLPAETPTPLTMRPAQLPTTPEKPSVPAVTPRHQNTPSSPIAGPSGLHLSSATHLALSTPVRNAYAALEAADNRALSTSGQKRLHGMVAGAKLWGNRRVLDPVSPSVFNATTDDVQADDAEEESDDEEESDEETGGGGKGRGAHLSEKARGKLREL